jgi:hypothetical protein
MNTLNLKALKYVKKIKPTNNISIIRTRTPNVNIINNKKHINFTYSNNELSSFSQPNEKNKTFLDCKKNIYSRSLKKLNHFQTSFSSSKKKKKISFKNKFFDILKNRSISKKTLSRYSKKISNSKNKNESNKKPKPILKGKKSISKNKSNNKINKNIPFLRNYNSNMRTRKYFSQNSNSKESINTISTSIYSNNLTEKEKTTLATIQNILFNLLSTSQNPKEIIKEFELINQRAISFTNTKIMSKTSNSSEDNINNQINRINLKFVEMEKENNELKKMIKEKIIGFEDVKNSIINVQKEINKIKKNKKEEQYKKNLNSNISMKNIKMNIKHIKKVNKLEDLKNEKNYMEDYDSNNDTIIQIKDNEPVQDKKNVMKLNFQGLEDCRKNFNEVFLSNYNEFSASWRNDVDKINERKNKNM